MYKYKISVICIAYNQEKYIKQTLDGILMQKINCNYELLISDDASTDSTPDIIREYEEKYPEIFKAFYYKENQYSQGKSTIDMLYKKAQGKYIAICEGDDFWIDENKLQLQLDYMESHPESSACVHSAYNCYADGVIMSNLFRAAEQDQYFTVEDVMERWLFPTASFFLRSKYVRDIPFQKDAPCGDYSLVVDLALQGKIYYLDRPMSVYRRMSKNSITQSIDRDKDRKKQFYIGVMKLLKRIDAYTNKQYHQSINIYAQGVKFNLLICEGDLKKIRRNNYFKDTSLSGKVKIILEVKSPILLCYSRKIVYLIKHTIGRVKMKQYKGYKNIYLIKN